MQNTNLYHNLLQIFKNQLKIMKMLNLYFKNRLICKGNVCLLFFLL